jgi:hypothetical protein
MYKEVSLKEMGFAIGEDDTASAKFAPLPIKKTASKALEWVT